MNYHSKAQRHRVSEQVRNLNLPIEIIEEREQIKAQLTPGLLLAVIKDVGVHHADGIVHDL